MKKKVVGFSFGRKMSNTEIMVKEALLECEKQACEIQFIRADELDIKICTGCLACVIGLISGKGRGDCVQKDDWHIVEEALMSSDALIIGSPIYETSPTGNFKVFCDRIGPSHDVTFRIPAYEKAIEEGFEPKQTPDERSKKKRVAAFITNGGARTENWLDFGTPIMYQFTFPMGVDVIDKYKYVGAMDVVNVIGRPDILERMRKIGSNLVEAMNAKTEEERIRWRGDEEGVCPVCHESLITIKSKGTEVECPVCGIRGNLSINDGNIYVHFSEEEQLRSRLKWDGKVEHSDEIKNGAMTQKQIEGLAQLKKKYINVGE